MSRRLGLFGERYNIDPERTISCTVVVEDTGPRDVIWLTWLSSPPTGCMRVRCVPHVCTVWKPELDWLWGSVLSLTTRHSPGLVWPRVDRTQWAKYKLNLSSGPTWQMSRREYRVLRVSPGLHTSECRCHTIRLFYTSHVHSWRIPASGFVLQLEKGPQIVEIKHFWIPALYKEVYV